MLIDKQSFVKVIALLIAVSGMTTVMAQGLEEVIVTAQRRSQNLQDVPISVNVLNAEQLGRAQVTLMRDLANIAPSLNFQGSTLGMNNNLSMRGIGAFAPQAGIQPAVALVVDDFQLSRQGELDMDMSDIESIQILSGPQGTLFGSNTVGGVVNVLTKQPTDTFESFIETSATTDSEFIGRYSVSGPFSERVRGRAMIYAKDRKGYVENVYPGAERQDGEEAYGGNVKLDIDVNETINLKLRGDYRRQDSNLVDKNVGMTGARQISIMGGGDPVLGQRVLDDISLSNSDFDRFHEAETWGIAANLTWKLSDSLTLKSISSYREHYVDFNLDSEASPATASRPLGATQIRGYHTDTSIDGKRGGPFAYDAIVNGIEYFTQEMRFEYSSDVIEGLFGAFYNHNDEFLYADLSRLNVTYPAVNDNFTIFTTQMDEALRYGQLYLRSWSVFGDVIWNVADTFRVFGGLRSTNEELTNDFVRYNYLVPNTLYNTYEAKPFHTLQVNPSVAPTEFVKFKSTRDTKELTGRVGAMWDFMPNANVYASYARGFTGAGSNTAHTAIESLATVPPMIGDAYELGVKSMFLDSRLRLNVAVFKSEITDVQLFRTNPQLLLTEFANAGGVDIKGLEATVMTLIGENLTISGALSLLDTEMVGSLPQPCYAGQTAAQGCLNLDGLPGNEQDINGKPSQNTPELRYNITGTYELPLSSMPFDAFVTAAYTWTDEKIFEFSFQPIVAFEPPYGLADLTLGITDKQGKYEVSVFGKNVFDKVFTVERAVPSIGGTTGFRAIYDRNAHAYWGVKLRYNFQ